jgi:hypothetical protein
MLKLHWYHFVQIQHFQFAIPKVDLNPHILGLTRVFVGLHSQLSGMYTIKLNN